MKTTKFFQLLLCILYFQISLTGQERFECNGKILVSTTFGNTTSIFQPYYIPFAPPFLSILGNYQGSFDALGFNPKDNYVYGVELNTNNIVRFSLYTQFERIGKMPNIDVLNVSAGDCTPDGLYVCYDYKLHKILVFDVVDQFKLVRQIDLFWDPKSPNQGPFKSRIFDFAFSPTESKTAYSYQPNSKNDPMDPDSTLGRMLKINLDFNDANLGMVTPQGKVLALQMTHMSGLAFSTRGNLFGFGSSFSGPNPVQNKFFEIDPGPGQIRPILTHAYSPQISDACSCPYSLLFTNSAPTNGMYCNNDTRKFEVGFHNNSFSNLSDVVLTDTFPPGTVIKSVSNTFQGKIETGTGVGTNILVIKGLSIPTKQKIFITIELTSINANVGDVFNQAFLTNLPDRFPKILASDDINSSTEGDRCNFEFITRKIENISWKIRYPTDCLNANNGEVVVTSPTFMIGKKYKVSLRNKRGWDEYFREVIIDDKNSFTLDSMLAGDYQLFNMRLLEDNCGLALKDTTIILDPPHSSINLTLSSNGPVCEGETLKLKSSMDVDAIVSWNGPNFYGSAERNPSIVDIRTYQGGKFDVEVNYGYCKQKKSMNVDVNRQFESKIEGKVNYCARDTLSLYGIANTENVSYTWSGPNEFRKIDSFIKISKVAKKQEGVYKLVATNGGCYDTSEIDIKILPTPTVNLEEKIITDYCDPITLLPELSKDGDEVTYRWQPSEGLSCKDCFSPVVLPIVQSGYKLVVENSYNCKDSANTQIILDKDRIAFAPNVFSPNASFSNRQFELLPNCVVHYIKSLVIYDRSGNRIFNTKAASPTEPISLWDGLSSDKTVAPGVYVWIAKVILVDGKEVQLTGDITLL
jgi:uncharacterized repeat protein (TIGR01451 family)